MNNIFISNFVTWGISQVHRRQGCEPNAQQNLWQLNTLSLWAKLVLEIKSSVTKPKTWTRHGQPERDGHANTYPWG